MSQISLPFEWTGQGRGGDFLVSDANRIAVRHLEGWRDWPLATSVLTGPPRSGRSLLGRRFAAMSGGEVIDDAQGEDEQTLFHAWNDAQTSRRPLLLIGEVAPTQWSVGLADLRSRLAAAPHIRIDEPDEALARALIERAFGDMGASFAVDLPDWLLRRIERSYAAIADVTRLLNDAALSSGRKISVPMAKEVLQGAGFLPIVGQDPNL